ncbi:hypothetical protein CFE70_009603 [Pyrenophora teres f. teres 0-1]|uniref:Uncharacterized protein n=1 Tax=Pyrenophora teres f. teres (strain 0-1) TaxID=861557 RepID=E3RUY0_PYRTT|nr:hypothetical protein PTT_12923 [Pyrenophora teres f. teres 0-1]
MASFVDSAKYYGGFDPESLCALAKARCLKVDGIDNDKDIMAMLMQQDNETGCHPWANDEDISDLESGKAWNSGDPFPAKEPMNAQKKENTEDMTPEKDDEGWIVAGAKGKKGKGKTQLEKKMAETPGPATKPADGIPESPFASLSEDELDTAVKDDASSVAETEARTCSSISEIPKPKSEAGSSTKAASVTAPTEGADGKVPTPISQLATEWDATWAGRSKLSLVGTVKETSYAGKAAGKAGSLKAAPKVNSTGASKPVSQIVSAGAVEPAPFVKTESMVSNSPAIQKTWDWASSVEEEEESEKELVEKEQEQKSVEEAIPSSIQDEQEQPAANNGNVEAGEKPKKKNKRGKKGGKKVKTNKTKLVDSSVDEPAGVSVVDSDAKESENLPAAASSVAIDTIEQSEDLLDTASSAEPDTAKVILETTEPADVQKEDVVVSVTYDIDVSGSASSTDNFTTIIESSPSVASTDYESADEHTPNLDTSPEPEINTLPSQKPADKGSATNFSPLALPTTPSTTSTISSSSSTAPTLKMSRAQRRREKKARQEYLFYDELVDEDMRSPEAIIPRDEAVSSTVPGKDSDNIDTAEHEQPVQPSLASSAADADSEADADATPAGKPKPKKRGKKGGKKAQKKAAKTATDTQDTEQTSTELVMEDTKTLFQGYEIQAAGLAVGLVMYLAAFMGVWLGHTV